MPYNERDQAPITAGTFSSEICFVCIVDGNEVASALTDTPHPVYTDGYGNSITQKQMVQLGGEYGLNN